MRIGRIKNIGYSILVGGLVVGSFFAKDIYNANFLGFKSAVEARKLFREGSEAEKKELSALTTKALKRAEFFDGQRGMSLTDTATLAHELGYTGIIREGDRAYIRINEYFSPRLPSASLLINGPNRALARMDINKETLRAYAKDRD